MFKWNSLVFYWCLYNKIMNYYVATWRLLSNFSSSVEKYFKSECCEWVKYFYSRTYTCFIIIMLCSGFNSSQSFECLMWVNKIKYVCHYQEKTFLCFLCEWIKINICVIIRRRHFVCFLFFAYKLPLPPNEYKPTQKAFQN